MLSRIISFGVFAILGSLNQATLASELSKQLTPDEIKRAASILGFSAIHRAWTAHALPSSSLGVDVGLETAFVLRRNLFSQGDGTAVIPRIVPVPRIWFSWDMPFDLSWSASLAPGFLFDGISTYGSALQWYAFELQEIKSSVSTVVHFTHVNVFSDLKVNHIGAAIQISRDMGSWLPFAGAGLVTGNANLAAALAAESVKPGPYTLLKSHFYLGTRFDLATKLSVQVDLIGSKFAFGFLFAETF
jgi:hypothetical protein